MAERAMTLDERERFDREQIQHEQGQGSAGPTSDDSEETPESITTPVVVGNPD